jgi:hypothetical protein
MSRIFRLLAALPVVIAFGVVDGIWSERWGPSPDLEQAAARLDEVPIQVGNWEGHDKPIDKRQLERLGIRGYVNRVYVNRRTGAELEVFLVYGKRGPICVHTPDVCFEGAGYTRQGAITRRTAPRRVPAEFWTARFRPAGGAMFPPKRIDWAWTINGDWQAPDSPRLAFARSAALYKIYVIHNMRPQGGAADNDPTPEFVRQFLPAVNRCLYAGS